MSSWNPPLATRLQSRLLAIACETAARFREPERVEELVRENASPGWTPHGLAEGHSGLALMSAQLHAVAPKERWNRVGGEYLARAERHATPESCAPGLFSGLTSLAMAAWYLSRSDGRRSRRQDHVDAWLEEAVPEWVRRVLASEAGLPAAAFDLLSGLAGVGTYFLQRFDRKRGRRTAQTILKAVVELILSDPPRWRTPIAAMVGDEFMRRTFPNGVLDCGLAHGQPGLLAFLALARISGVEAPRHEEALVHAANWLVRCRRDDRWGPNWPPGVALPGPRRVKSVTAARAAWCYGAPGVARALWLAGVALDDEALRRLAVRSIRAALKRPAEVQRLASPTFCHGLAGLLQIVLRFAVDTRDPEIGRAAASLAERVASAHDPAASLGYRTVEWQGSVVDKPAVLDGAPGVLLVLLAAATNVEPAWDRAFLLS